MTFRSVASLSPVLVLSHLVLAIPVNPCWLFNGKQRASMKLRSLWLTKYCCFLNWNQTEPRAAFVVGGAMTKCPTTPHVILITSPQPELEVCFVWASVSGTCFWTSHRVVHIVFRCGVYAKILQYFAFFVCMAFMYMPSAYTESCLMCPVFESACPYEEYAQAPSSPAWAKKFPYIFKVSESWKQMISDNHLACRSVSSTKALWPVKCYWNNHSAWLCLILGLWLHCAVSECSLMPGLLCQRQLHSQAVLLVWGQKIWRCSWRQSLNAPQKKWLCCPFTHHSPLIFLLLSLLRKE